MAGQINGTSGYEEAAGQGLIAGVNAVAKLKGEPPLILKRHESYIGVLIDDLVTKGTNEPYRMFTSRAEYRLLLNHGSSEFRLSESAKNYGLVNSQRVARQSQRAESLKFLVELLEKQKGKGGTLADAVRRGESIDCEELRNADRELAEEVLYRVAYRGYIEREGRVIEKLNDLERVRLSQDIDYLKVTGLRKESALKLNQIHPTNLGQASRISGVNPTDITILMLAAGKK
jgi:tRNA uridine 5-carboxymethylaminomethyl modification enzyme